MIGVRLHLSVPSLISSWILVLSEPVTKCVSLCCPTWVRSVIPATGAETTVIHISMWPFALWDFDLGLKLSHP